MTLSALWPSQRFNVHTWVNGRPNIISFSTPAASAAAATAVKDAAENDYGGEASEADNEQVKRPEDRSQRRSHWPQRIHLYRVNDAEVQALQSALDTLEAFVSKLVDGEEVQEEGSLTIPLLSMLSSSATKEAIDVPLAIITSRMHVLIAKANRAVLSQPQMRLFKEACAQNRHVLVTKNLKLSLDRGSSDDVCVLSHTFVSDEALNIPADIRDHLIAAD